MDRINGAGHVDHLFVAEDVPTNRPPTEITAEWLNSVQEEIAKFPESLGAVLDPANRHQMYDAVVNMITTAFSAGVPWAVLDQVIQTAGMAVNHANNAQLLEAIQRLIDAQSGNYALDTGAANAYVVALSPAITAYEDGLTVRVKAVNANNGASTLNAGGGAVALVNDVGGALADGDIPAGGIFTATYIASENKFRITSLVASQGDSRFAKLAGDAAQSFSAATPAQFDNTTKVANTEFVKRAMGQFAGSVTIEGSAMLTAAAHAGRAITINAASATLMVPLGSTVADGTIISFTSVGAFNQVVSQGTDVFWGKGGTVTFYNLGDGDTLSIEWSVIANRWIATGGSALLPNSPLFGALLATSGYQKLPSGVILQWGVFVNNVGSYKTISFPITFPTECFFVIAQSKDNGGNASATTIWNNTASSFQAFNPAAVNALYFAMGK